MPERMSFIDVMDMFCKMHKVMHISHDGKIKQLMLFLDMQVYKFKVSDKDLSINTKRVAQQIKIS